MTALPMTAGRFAKSAREEVRVVLDEFKGFNLVDARVFASSGDGDPIPTRKGLSVRAEQLPDLIAALEEARDAAVQMGWLE